MARTLTVYPCAGTLPCVGELLGAAQSRLVEQLLRRELRVPGVPDVGLQLSTHGPTSDGLSITPDSPMHLPEGVVARLSIRGLDGHADIEALHAPLAAAFAETGTQQSRRRWQAINAHGGDGRWVVALRGSQPALVAFAAVMLAATMADMTGGWVVSDDLGMGSRHFPASGVELDDLYAWAAHSETEAEAAAARRSLGYAQQELWSLEREAKAAGPAGPLR